MLLKLEKLIAKYGMKITGVIQAGAHWGEEVDLLLSVTDGELHLFEPCEDSYEKLLSKSWDFDRIYTHNFALGASCTEAYLNVETKNNGQSNSILKPKQHLLYYPDIEFKDVERALMIMLDNVALTNCNFLMLDVQGYEHEVLKGATETLKHIDYIYTEVNREELYENCAMVEDLDNYLTDFRRVETKWKRKGFGDALYIRKTLL
jgi:FkbM family methyltransferase